MSAPRLLAACTAIAWLAIPAAPARAGDMSGFTGPAAPAVLHALTDGELIRCFDTDLQSTADPKLVDCQVQRNEISSKLYYGDANGHGPDSDVLAITFYLGDPTGNGESVSVDYFRRDGGRYHHVRSFEHVYGHGVVPGTRVEFGHGRVSFLYATVRPQDSESDPKGRTRYVLDLR